jgi:DnaJ-class molecular chaperone
MGIPTRIPIMRRRPRQSSSKFLKHTRFSVTSKRDKFMIEGLKGRVPPPGAGGSSPFSNGGGGPNKFNPRKPEDVFADFFGSSSPFGGFTSMGSRNSRFQDGTFPGVVLKICLDLLVRQILQVS